MSIDIKSNYTTQDLDNWEASVDSELRGIIRMTPDGLWKDEVRGRRNRQRRQSRMRARRNELMELKRKINSLYDTIKHGDEQHQGWLKEAIEKHFNIKIT